MAEPNVAKLRELYTELEFRNQLQSLDHPNNPNNSNYKQAAQSDLQTKPVAPIEEDHASLTSSDDQLGQATYHTVLNQADWDALFNRLNTAKRFAFDTETTSLDYRIAQIVGFRWL